MLPRLPPLWAIIALTLAAVCLGQYALRARDHARNLDNVRRLAQVEAALGASEAARKRSEHSLVLQARKNAATARETASARASLGTALAASRPWAEESVPEGVKESFK